MASELPKTLIYEELKNLQLEEQKKLFEQNSAELLLNLYSVVIAAHTELFAWYIGTADEIIIKALLKTFARVIFEYINSTAEYPIDVSALESNFEILCEKSSLSTWRSISLSADFRNAVTALAYDYTKSKRLRSISEHWIRDFYTYNWNAGITSRRCDKLAIYILEHAKLNTRSRCHLAHDCFKNGMRRIFDACLDKLVQQENPRREFIKLIAVIT